MVTWSHDMRLVANLMHILSPECTRNKLEVRITCYITGRPSCAMLPAPLVCSINHCAPESKSYKQINVGSCLSFMVKLTSGYLSE